MAIIKLSPLDKEGIRFDRPSHEVTWQKLTNCVFKDGSLVPRPGFGPVYGMGSVELDTLASELKTIVYIGQIRNPGGSAVGRESFTVTSNTVRPNASANVVAGWTGDHLDVDDVVPDGTTFLRTSTAGASKSLNFGVHSTTFATIFGLIIRGRARVTEPSVIARLGIYYWDGSNSFLIGYVDVASDGSESDPWVEFAFNLSTHPETETANACLLWFDSNIDDFQILVKLESTDVLDYQMIEADANGTYSQWKDANDGGTAVFTDVESLFGWLLNEAPASSLHFMAPSFTGSGTDNKQSFGFTTTGTLSSISKVGFVGNISKPESAEPKFELYWRSAAAVETLVETFTGKVGRTMLTIDSTMTTNPAGGAWTQAALDAGEFFIKCIIGNTSTILTGVGIAVEGITSAAGTVDVDYISLDICGATSSAAGTGIIDYTRLYSYQNLHTRLDNDGTVTLTDITNSVAMTTSPPNIPVDSAVLYGQVYLVNGRDATRRYPRAAADNYESLTTNNGAGTAKLTGRTIAQHGNRILYGWVTDDTSITPERVSYSKFNDGGTHNHVSAGEFDLLDTPGGVVKLIPINEDVCAALKEEGIYDLIKTGQAAFPYRRDLIDPSTGCIAKMTAKPVTLKDGSTGVLFLGINSTKYGLNVFLFDGSQVVPVGDPIARKLEKDTNPQVLSYSFAEVDPKTGAYWLFLAETCDEVLPKQAWVMDINSFAWTRAEFPFYVSAAGQWNLLQDPTQSTQSGQRYLYGKRTMVLGTSFAMPFSTHDNPFDIVKGTAATTEIFASGGSFLLPFTSTIETGDLVRPQDMQVVSYRLHLAFTVKARSLRVVISSSEDGGESFNTSQEYAIGLDSTADFDEKQYKYFDLTPSHANIVRYKVAIGPDVSTQFKQSIAPIQPWQIDDFRIEIVGAADGA